ncbi:unnamed protein product [Prunus armeniaca]|uniref:Uncharacterized protein n=1 Tax=Prunus armeniaca TaxID=36596 RepID=A0A6J5VAD7_PRUAR|nr:unnamed protein product [Prunus armeniaca]
MPLSSSHQSSAAVIDAIFIPDFVDTRKLTQVDTTTKKTYNLFDRKEIRETGEEVMVIVTVNDDNVLKNRSRDLARGGMPKTSDLPSNFRRQIRETKEKMSWSSMS